MPTYLVTYKFAYNDTHLERLDAFMAQLTTGNWWAETGSAILVHSDEAIDAFCKRILAPSCFDEGLDVAVVFDLDHRHGRARGSFHDYGLFTVAPWIKRL